MLAAVTVSAQDISVTLFMPDQAQAGTKIPVKVVIHKGTHSDFARFKQKIPPGFEVEPMKAANSDFTFKDGEVNFIWLKLPPQEDILIEYALIPDVRLHGIFRFGGLFSYINQGEREEITVPEKAITILASKEATTGGAVAVSGPEKQHTVSSGSVPVVYRQVPVKVRSGDQWIVKLLVKRGFVTKLARLEENTPAGYIAENINGMGAIFSYRSGKTKFIWMNMPEDTLFVVAYKLVPVDKTAKKPPQVTGTFSYMLNDRPATKKIIQVNGNIPLHARMKDYAAIYAGLAATTGEKTTKSTPAETAPAVTETAGTPVPGAAVPAVTQPPQETVTEKPRETTPVSENRPGQPTEIVQHAPVSAGGIWFRVQVLASRNPVEIESYIRQHHIPGKIYREEQNGLYKYTTGSFKLYKDARAFVRQLKETTDIDRAFVTAYDNGKRISVREALDRTGQKWFR